jgi:alkylation response protein AidB-like acyl-CoA dehydrogenase
MPTFTPEQEDFRAAVRDFCEREVTRPGEHDALTGGDHSLDRQLYAKMAELGWLGVSIDEAYGGSGGGMVDACVFLEETSRGQAPMGAYGTTLIVAGAYERFGSEEQKQAMLGGIAQGSIEAIAMSEPGAGSDVGAMTCRARRENGHYVLDGQKTWISNAHLAEHTLVIARTDASGSKHEGLTMLEVPKDTAGMEIRPIETMGGSEVNDVFFADARVPAENLVGQEGRAWTQLMAGLNVERLIIAAQHLGMAQRTFDDLLAYVREREQFGRPIGTFQALRHRIADLATELECCRLLVYDVAAKVDEDPNRMLPREASMAKLKCTEVGKQIALEGMQMMGGYGYATEYPMEGHVRRALVGTIYGGTSEVQREIIGKTLGL